jgi:flagellin
MAIVINSNPTATSASNNLAKANEALRKSLARLSSGHRIVNPEDDAGGLAVAYKINAQLNRNDVVRQNVQNGISLLQVQDGALAVAGKIVDRISELRMMAEDVTKNVGDVENYSKEFIELQRQLSEVHREKFNGVVLFTSNAGGDGMNSQGSRFSYTLLTHDSGRIEDGSVSLNVVNLQTVLSLGGPDARFHSAFNGVITDSQGFNLGNVSGVNATSYTSSDLPHLSIFTSDGFLSNLLSISLGQLTSVIENIADARAENGAEQSRLMMVEELLSSKVINLEAAHGRIMDVDVALESSRLAKNSVMVQSSAAMVAQANNLTAIALTLLNG